MKSIRLLKINSNMLTKAISIFGEILITSAVVFLLYLFWQQTLRVQLITQAQAQTVQNLSREWDDSVTVQNTDGKIPQVNGVGLGDVFGIIYIPRLGEGTARAIVNGVGKEEVLDRGNFGHYPKTQMPGQNGNFALAVHRTDWGSPFGDAPKLQIGDQIFVETQNGYYTYVFRNYEFVFPHQTDVLSPVPGQNIVAKENILTITTCNPLLGSEERLIVYAVLDSWKPRSEGPPADMNILPRADIRHDPVDPQTSESPSDAEKRTPSAPNTLAATSAENWADITWSEPSDVGSSPVEAYLIYSSTDGGNSWSKIATVGPDQRTYRIESLSAETTYYFAVSAASAAGEGPLSVAFVSTASFIPSQPTNLVASVICVTDLDCAVTYQFDYPQFLGVGQTSYEIGFSNDGRVTWSYSPISSNTGSFVYLGPGEIVIRATNYYGSSTSSIVPIN